MTDTQIIKMAQASARIYANGERQPDTDQAAINGYQADALGERRDLWDGQQELLYRMAFAQQLIALGL